MSPEDRLIELWQQHEAELPRPAKRLLERAAVEPESAVIAAGLFALHAGEYPVLLEFSPVLREVGRGASHDAA